MNLADIIGIIAVLVIVGIVLAFIAFLTYYDVPDIPPITPPVSVSYNAELRFDSVVVESDIYVRISDAIADDPDNEPTVVNGEIIGGDTVEFKLRSVNLQGTITGSGIVFEAKEKPGTDGIFEAHIIPSVLANPRLPINALKLPVQVDNDNPTDTLIISYRSILDADSAVVNLPRGFGYEATQSEPIRWDSHIYELGDAATLSIFDVTKIGGGQTTISAFIRTSTSPAGYPILLTESADDNS